MHRRLIASPRLKTTISSPNGPKPLELRLKELRSQNNSTISITIDRAQWAIAQDIRYGLQDVAGNNTVT